MAALIVAFYGVPVIAAGQRIILISRNPRRWCVLDRRLAGLTGLLALFYTSLARPEVSCINCISFAAALERPACGLVAMAALSSPERNK